ncbi:MAG: hypothetical protein M3417_12920 [Actinomycetota bacterium]|nr:hypothetical protein [Actinomycetota bacterium]
MTETHDLTTTTTPMHLTVDPYWDLIEVLAYGTVCDLIDSERFHALVEDRVAYVLDETLSEVVGFVVKGYAELDPLGARRPGAVEWAALLRPGARSARRDPRRGHAGHPRPLRPRRADRRRDALPPRDGRRDRRRGAAAVAARAGSGGHEGPLRARLHPV